jgi:hypothetical protein
MLKFWGIKICLCAIMLNQVTVLTAQTRKDVRVNFMLRGYIYAQSSIIDTLAFGGFAESDNYPKKLNPDSNPVGNGLIHKVDTSKIVAFGGEYNGYNFYIINRSDTITCLRASDSRLYVIAEAFIDKKWQPIEYLPSSWCGNSYHNVYLRPNEYWQFSVPKYDGRIATRIRYRLALHNNTFVYSNEFFGRINKKQLTDKQGHNPNGIMDPYND